MVLINMTCYGSGLECLGQGSVLLLVLLNAIVVMGLAVWTIYWLWALNKKDKKKD